MTREFEETTSTHFDVAVIGAGPAGCEAALAAAREGAHTLCLTINLDLIGYPPATPVLVDGRDDRRQALLSELADLGGQLPALLRRGGIAGTDGVEGRVLVDRRKLGLRWKELLENEAGVVLRQALVTDLERPGASWGLTTKLGESFTAAAVVIAAGTFLNGRVVDAGRTLPGGRWAEIPANSLAKNLQNRGLELVEVRATTSPRLSARQLSPKLLQDASMIRDGSQLGEVLGFGLETDGSRAQQLENIRRRDGLEQAWITRGSYSVLHLVLAAQQLHENLECTIDSGLFFSGRAAGSCNYTEAAALGFIAGTNAARGARGEKLSILTKKYTLVMKLLQRISQKEKRPVTVRIDEETGC